GCGPPPLERPLAGPRSDAARTADLAGRGAGGMAGASEGPMSVSFDWSALRGIRWHQYALRFVLGGLVTMGAGAIANAFGPVFGGLFLAFPALFTASATLIERREILKKARLGLHGQKRGRRAAALDAAGTVLGSIALGCFACIAWRGLPLHAPAAVLCLAGVCWLAVAVLLWCVRKKYRGSRSKTSDAW